MIYNNFPDKWIRKAIFDGLNGSNIEGHTIKVYDFRVPVKKAPPIYILMTEQTATPDKGNKCSIPYSCTIRVEVVTQYASSGNTGSRLLADEGMQLLLNWFNNKNLIGEYSGYKVTKRDIDFGTDIQNTLSNFTIFRKVAILTFYLQ